MTAPAMPSPARVVAKSLTHLERRGYSRAEARRITCEVIESIGAQKADFAPWAVDWLRALYRAALGTPAGEPGNTSRTGGNSHG